MDHLFALRAASLYVPVSLATLLWWLRRPSLRERAGILVASVWNASALLALSEIAQKMGWWHFEAQHALFFGIPMEFYLGWIVLWAALPQLAFPREPMPVALLVFGAFDFLFMPKLSPLLQLGPKWWIGEAIGLLFVLVPAILIARWTARDEHLPTRAAMQFATFAALTLWLLPSVIFAARGREWPRLSAQSLFMAFQFACLAGVPGVAAVYEFASRGQGTPLPYDPPRKVVTTGPYAYVANPMQCAAALVLVVWGIGLQSGWVALAGVMAHIYSAGIAAWDEGDDLSKRFGEPWVQYRSEVRNWIPRWRPYVAARATLYVSESCGMCSQVKRWFERRNVGGLDIVPAENYPGRLMRISYVHPDGAIETGVVAIARAVEHIHVGWAYLGWGARLPLVNRALQLLVDACGGEPRELGCEVPAARAGVR